MREIECYKVTYEGGSVLACGDAWVEYKIGKWVSAPEWLANQGYHLLVFGTLAEAKKFSLSNRLSGKVQKAKARGIIEPLPIPSHWATICSKSQEVRPEPNTFWPDGTIMAKEVMLLG